MIYDDFSLASYKKEIREDSATIIHSLSGNDDWDDDILLYPNLDDNTRNEIIREMEDISTISYA